MHHRTRFAAVPVAFLLFARSALGQQSAPQPPPQASPAALPQPTPPPAAVPAPTPQQLEHRRLSVDVESTKPAAVVERRVSVTEGKGILMFDKDDQIWEQVCVAPCRVDLDRYSTYRIADQNRVAGSSPFTLPQGPDAMHMRVDAGDRRAHHWGGVLTSVGIAAAAVGISLVVGAKIFSDESGARTAGFITGGSGLALLGVGIPLTLMTSTSVWAEGRQL